eukprot:5172793-Pleurochrysis_carterae.AAC.2
MLRRCTSRAPGMCTALVASPLLLAGREVGARAGRLPEETAHRPLLVRSPAASVKLPRTALRSTSLCAAHHSGPHAAVTRLPPCRTLQRNHRLKVNGCPLPQS